jgi:hypothetical protein
MFKRLMEFKEKFYPATQKNVNVNIDLFDERLKKWREERMKVYNIVGDGGDIS